MTSNLLGISVTGLRVAQTSLNTTGHNIANAGVEGYSRQRVESETNPASLQGVAYVGNGTRVSAIERIANDFIDSQLRFDTSLNKDVDAYYGNISELDTLLSDVSTGLSSGLESFFASVQNGADDPTSIPARQLIISESENLADRFNAIYSRVESIEDGINSKMTSAVTEINSLVQNIADLNQRVGDALGTGAQPNDLIDQRQQTILELAKLVSIQTFDEGFGQINVVVGSGQNLVIGSEARQLDLIQSAEDASQFDIVFQGGQSAQSGQVVTDLLTGGELGGLIRFRDDILNETYNQFGRIAVVMADTFNEVHQQGVNLNNEFGGDFFYDVNDPVIAANRVIGNSANALPPDRNAVLNIVDSTQLQATDYSVSIESGNLYRVTRASDGEEVARGALSGSFPFNIEFDGLQLSLQSGSYQNGDEFKLVPFKSGGRDFSSSLINPEDIAFGLPLMTDSSIGNIGSGQISSGEILSLVDQDNQPLPLLATPGEMNPPLIVRFTSDTRYDILDNSDPGNPVQLDPPVRNQGYIVGGTNELFATDPGGTMVTTEGEMIGLPEGRRAVINSSLQLSAPVAVAPSFANTNFSASGDQFGFDVVISNTIGGVNDGTFSVVVSGAAILDEDSLLQEINAQLSTTDARAYIADNGTLAFRLDTPGYGDISLQNYNPDPDGGGDAAPGGQANALFGFNIEGGTFTTVGDTDGISGDGVLSNGYPAEAISITAPPEIPGGTPDVANIFTTLNASASEIASLLNNVSGVSANAFNYVEISNLQVSQNEPLQFNINGENLIEYGLNSVTGEPELSNQIPDPVTEPENFYSYLSDRINSNSVLSDLSIHAVAGIDPVSGANELRIYESQGTDIVVGLTAVSGETIDISDGNNPNLTLTGMGNSVSSSISVGGRIDVSLAEDLTLSTFPPNSMLFGDTTATDFARSTYLGIQASIEGIPEEGDSFTLDFNNDAASDNRNALSMSSLEDARIIGGGVASYGESYSALVEDIGIETASTKINLDASEQVLEQSVERRNAVSGVNLDEEAANLIRFEQMFSANAQVISVARDLFDRLIQSF